MTDDFFRSRLDQMIDHSHPLAVLASRLPWDKMESRVAPQFAHKERPLQQTEESPDLAGPVVRVSGGNASNAGRPRLAMRLMIALTLLKNSFDLSDEELVQRFAENVYWQHFAGLEYLDPRPPCDATQIGRFRSTLGEAGLEELLSATIHTAVDVGAIKKSEFKRVIVDTTVQEKAIAHPVDSRLLEICPAQGGCCCQALRHCPEANLCGPGQDLATPGRWIRPRQTVQATAPRGQTPTHHSWHPHSRGQAQDERHHRQRVGTDITEHLAGTRRARSHPAAPGQEQALRAARTRGGMHRLEACARKPYEFGVKVSVAVTHKQGLLVDARSFTGNPYDGHILSAQMEQSTILLQDLNVAPKQAVVDLGFRGKEVGQANPDLEIIHRGRIKTKTQGAATLA